MNNVEEFQKQQEEIESEVGYAQLSDILASYRLLVEDMIETIRELEESTSKEYQAKRLKQEASAKTGVYDN